LRLFGSILALCLLLGQALLGLPAIAAAPSTPTVIQSLKNDTSPALRTMQASPVAPSGKGNQSHRPLRPGQSGTKLPTAPNSIQTSTGAAAMPSTSTNFEGINNIDGVLPPDTNGDVGPNNYVQWVNLHYQVFDRTGGSLLGPSPGNTLWSGFGGVCETTNQGDPVVRYDRMANRWIFTQFAFTVDRRNNLVAPFVQCFAISTTGDPTGTYYRYAWTISNTYFPDYPKLAVWPDGYYMTVNFFSGNTFVGGGALAFDRAKMLNGQAATAIGFGPLGAAYGGSLPSDLDGSILPPSGAPNYFGAIDTNASPSGSTFQLWKFHVDFATPANSTFGLTSSHTPDFNLPVATYFWDMCNGLRSCIQQPGTSQGLDAVSDRLMNRLQYRRFADGHESLVANHTVGVGAGNNQAAVRWYEIRNLSTTPTIYQQSTYAPGTDSRWMGSIAMDQAGDIALGYSVSSSNVSPSIRYTGRLAGDTLATLPEGEATLIEGSGSQTSSFNRWGDYSMMAVDPTDDCTFWYTQEYYTATSTAGWQTRVGSFKFPSCGLPGVPTGVVATAGSGAATVSWTAPSSNGGSSVNKYTVTSSPGGFSASASGTDTWVTVKGLTAGTSYTFTVVASNANGTGPASSPSNSVIPYAGSTIEDSSSSVTYAGSWGVWSNQANSGSTAHYSAQTGASATLFFSGPNVGVTYLKDFNGGIATITIDGTAVDQLDTFAAVQTFQQQKYYAVANGPHSLAVRVSGSKNPSSAYTWITFDAFVTPVVLPPGTTFEDSSTLVTYSGTWAVWSNPGNSGGTTHYSAQAGASTTLYFSGPYVGVTYLKDVNGGIATISIDGAAMDQLDTYAPVQTFQQQKFYAVTDGPHRITVRVSGTKNPASAYTWITVDAFVAQTGLPAGTVFEDNSVSVGYSGTWMIWSNPANSGGTAHYSAQTAANATLSFSGPYVGVMYLKDVNGGIATISIDHTVVDQLDTYAAIQTFQQQTYYVVSAGSHSISVSISGVKNAASTATWVTLDGFIAPASP